MFMLKVAVCAWILGAAIGGVFVMCLVRLGNVLFFLFGLHRRDSRGPVAAGNHKEPTTEAIEKRSLPRRKP